MRNKLFTISSLTVSVALAGMSCTALANTVLTVSSWGGPNHGINQMVWPTWGEWVEEATEGRVTLEVVQDLGPPQSQMDIIADGVGDVSWLFHGLYPGRFEATKLPEIPFFKQVSSEDMSAAYWRVHDAYLSKANEHKGLVVVGVGVHGPGTIFSKERINNLQDLSNQRMRIGGGLMGEIADKLNIAGVALPPTGTYESATQGVISGALLTRETLKSMHLAEAFAHAYEAPGGFYRGSFSIVVNQDKWDSIDAADQEAIIAVSGEKLSALFGKMMDQNDATGVEFALEKGMTFTSIDDDSLQEFKQIVKPMTEQWISNNSDIGFDSKAAYEMFRAEIGVE